MRPRKRHVVGKEGPPPEVDHHARQRLVERRVGRREAHDARAIAERCDSAWPTHDARVLDQVVRVDVQVAGAAKRQVEPAVARDLLEHVIEEGQSASRP